MTPLAKIAALGLLLPLFCTAGRTRAAELTEEESKKAEAAIQQFESADANTRAAAETELRGMGPKVLPLLSKAKIGQEEGHLRLRAILVDMSVDTARVTDTDANALMQIGKEEASAKRYNPAYRCYRRANKIYEKLKDDAGDRKDQAKKEEYRDLEQKADRRADRAENLAKGRTHTGLNLGFVKVGVEKDLRDDDW